MCNAVHMTYDNNFKGIKIVLFIFKGYQNELKLYSITKALPKGLFFKQTKIRSNFYFENFDSISF